MALRYVMPKEILSTRTFGDIIR